MDHTETERRILEMHENIDWDKWMKDHHVKIRNDKPDHEKRSASTWQNTKLT